ncbi:hypothetical protein B0H10DRAFT_1963395 [Mycena sp. CBHHK59/15]|nr:hypothetical protein B0H10DRAFT_1963395 [Mycena sp. CBHHK59/15]
MPAAAAVPKGRPPAFSARSTRGRGKVALNFPTTRVDLAENAGGRVPTLTDLLEQLLNEIEKLPASFRSGRRDGPLAKYLTPALLKDKNPVAIYPTHPDGPNAAFSQQWERVFQLKSGETLADKYGLVCRGKHGLALAHAWATHYVALPLSPGELGSTSP